MPRRVSISFALADGAAGGDESAAPTGPAHRARLRRLLVRAATATLAAEGVADAELSITLMDDDGMADLHRRYLRRDGPTDVLAFALHGPGEAPLGDVYIGYQRARQQATSHGVALRDELARLAIHGTLHVLGHEHPEGAGREASAMWAAQERLLREVTGA